jgi:hypothetical protein
MAMAVALVLLVVGTILFHFLSPWWFTPIASNWKMMDDTVNITFVVTGMAHHSDLGGRRCDVGTGFVCMGQVRHRTERRGGG